MISLSWTDFPEPSDEPGLARASNLFPPLFDCHAFIEGDNYPVLQKLQEDFAQKISFIYIDPPYNTGNSFTYSDDFSVRGAGKNHADADKHSAWLSFMSRRLRLARNLLAADGCIFIAIDQGELYPLKLLCDQIFGEDNFVNDFMWLHGKGKKDRWSRTLQQHTLCYAKSKSHLPPFRESERAKWAKTNPDDDSRGNWFSGSISFTEKRSNPNHRNFYSVTAPDGRIWTRQWLVPKQEMDALIADGRIYFGRPPRFGKVPRVKIFNETETEVIPRNIIQKTESTRSAQNHLDKILGVKGAFENPKPVPLIAHFLKICRLPESAVILDFFAGSGTTFEAVCAVNKEDGGQRRCILVQKNEPCKSSASKSAGFKTISDLCYARCQKTAAEYGTKISRHALVLPQELPS